MFTTIFNFLPTTGTIMVGSGKLNHIRTESDTLVFVKFCGLQLYKQGCRSAQRYF